MRKTTVYGLLSLLFILFISCSRQENLEVTAPSEVEEFVSGYTSGEIGSSGEIGITLAKEVAEENQIEENLFVFSPAIKGKIQWVNSRTLVFKPDVKLPNGTEFTVKFDLAKVFEVPEGKEEFVFRFKTIEQNLEVQLSGLESDPADNGNQRIEGTIITADEADSEQIKRVIKATQEGAALSVEWMHQGKTRHQFQITGIKRKEQGSKININWDGSVIGATAKGGRQIELPVIGEFELLETKIFRDENPRIELVFSDPLDASQNLNGLVRIESGLRLNYIISGNKIIVNPRERRNSAETLVVDESIKSISGKRLGKVYQREVRFYQPKPEVDFLGKGVSIPRSENLYLPFRAVSVGAVDVQITRIFESNIGQFFQEQNLGGTNAWNIRQVGRPVYQGVIALSDLGAIDYGTWNNYALDLSELIEPEPGAIYRVEMNFRKHQAVYPCEAGSEIGSPDLENQNWELTPEEETEHWMNFGGYRYYRDYSWNDRDNPCKPSYYYRHDSEARNVLASDLGIIAKKGAGEEVSVFVTDLRKAAPKTAVKVELFDYQQQILGSATTDANGKAVLQAQHEPYYVVASFEDQKGYLRMGDGGALSVSEFDVSGVQVQEGVKGFLYGERGVWRPGDTLFVSLILEDKNEVLPANHPVTFDLRNPSGQLVQRKTFTSSLNGFYVFEGKTDKQAPTGNWRLTAKVGGYTFNKTIKIETVKPNRLKMDVDFAEEFISARDRKMEATLSSQWLHGAIAKNLKADVEMSLSPSEPEFDNYRGYHFNDASVSFSSTPKMIFDGTLNSAGEVEFNHQMTPLTEGPARVKVNLKLRVFEPSGSFSVGQASTYYYPFKTLIGIKPPTAKDDGYGNWLSRDQAHTFKVVSVDEDGNPVGFKELEYEVYRIGWRWWWERSNEDLSNYFQRRNVSRVMNGKFTTKSDGSQELNIKLGRNENGGRYLVRVIDPKGNHSSSTVVYFSWWRGRNSDVSPAQLVFESDKASYQTGEKVTLTIPSSAGSRLLVSLETGSGVLRTEWIDGQAGETEYSFLADGSMSPNVYAHVMHIQPHAQDENDLPIRMYGVIPIEVEDPETVLSPNIGMVKELRPETETTITVSEDKGRPMTYTIALVDDGLLDLTNFKTPEPHTTFYAREALGIKTWDMFEFVTSGFSGNISRILSVGGDGSELRADPLNEANRFKPMVRFMGPFYLKAGAANQHTISIPNYVGSVRTMVIAGQDGAYGQAEQTTPVRKPVMVLATLPRVLGPAETVSLPVSVFAMKEGIKNVQVQVEVNEMFELQGDPSTTVSFDEPGDELVNFTLKTKSQIGVGKVRVEVKSGSETAYHEIEIAVRNPNTPFTDVKSSLVGNGEDWDIEFEPQGMVGTNTAILELSRIPPIDFGKRLRYLLNYPHGCIEQTTSSVFAQLYLESIMDLSSDRKAEIQKNVEAGIDRISKFLTISGGLSYWPGQENANSWGTNYAYHFLLEAKRKGYYVPSDLLSKINRYQSTYARGWRSSDYRRSDLIQAYRLYTLALANTPDLGSMNRFRERDDLSAQAKWRLAAAYVLVGQPEAAEEIISGASLAVPQYRELSGSYGSSLRDQAMILETVALLNRKDDAAMLSRDISKQLSDQRWLSTQTTAYGLIAITKFLEMNDVAGEIKAEYSVNGTKTGSVNSNAYILQIPVSIDEYNSNSLNVKNASGGSLYARLILEGTPLIGDNVSASNSLVQKVKFLNLNGEEIDPASIEQGTDFVAEVMVTNPGLRGDYEELALTQIFPSGWEIRNTRMDDESFKEPVSPFDYQDIRDDRVYTYFDLGASKYKVFRVQLNASYLGEFYLPAVSAEAMYDESISARNPGKWVKVVAAGSGQ